MTEEPNEPTDRRSRRRREETILFFAAALFLVVVGSVAIGVAYGVPALPLGLACLTTGAGLMGLLWLILTLMDRLSD